MTELEICVVKITDECGFSWRENVWVSDLPKMMTEIVKFLDSTPLYGFEVEFGVDLLRSDDGFIRETWKKFY